MAQQTRQQRAVRVTRRDFLRTAAGTAAATAAGGLVTSPYFSPAQAGPAATGKKDLAVGLFAEPPQFNPFYRLDIIGTIVGDNIHGKLVRVNPRTRSVEPELAESWSQKDTLTWIIKLRQGVQWHKGFGEFTAEDVDYTWNFVLEKKTFQFATALFPVQRVRALDRYTVEVRLKIPFGAFPLVTMEYGGMMVCKKAHEQMGPERYGREPVGAGPFELESWTRGSSLVLKKNARYWKRGLPHLERIVYRVIPDATVRMASLIRGEIDFMSHPDAKDVPEVKAGRKGGNLVYTSIPGWNWDYMAFTFPPHISADFPTAKSKELRQAISYALDRETIVKEIYFDEALVTDSPIPPGYMAYRPVPIRYPRRRDLGRARELMRRAGISRLDLEVITSDKEWLRRETELAASMLNDIGIRIKIVGLDIGTFNQRWLIRKDFQALLEDISIVSPDTDSTVYWFHRTGTTSWNGWQRPGMDEILDRSRMVSNPEERTKLYHQAVDVVLEECPFIYIAHVNNVRIHKKGLVGYDPHPQEYVVRFEQARWE
ncbi:MAG: ABC transporter substrate-binding protein [Armatimonadetes bacterium]|nr:ABC transporter substrate-binding protein [Armatimonadota bacterium]